MLLPPTISGPAVQPLMRTLTTNLRRPVTDRASESMSILHLIKGLGPGGAEHLLLGAAHTRGDAIERIDVAYLLPWKDHLVTALRELDVATHCLGVADPRDPRWLPRFLRLVWEGRYDIVHLHSPLVAALARPLLASLPAARRPRVVSTEHNSWRSHASGTRRLNSATYRWGDRWIAVSDSVRDSLPSRWAERTEVIVHGIDVAATRACAAHRDAARRELGLGPNHVVAITVANLRRQKGYPDLLQAAKQVIDAYPSAVFLAVGQGPLEAELRDQHTALGLGERFRFLGYREDVANLLGAADLFVLSSHYEGYPLALMEAAAAGLAVVATTVGGVPAAVTHGETGLLVRPKTVDELAESILRLCTDAELRHRMAHANAGQADRFDMAIATRKIEAVYAEAIDRKQMRRSTRPWRRTWPNRHGTR